MHAVDTNLLVRLIARDDPAQVEAAEAFVGGGAWVSHLVLEIARKAGHLPLGTFDRQLSRLEGTLTIERARMQARRLDHQLAAVAGFRQAGEICDRPRSTALT